MWSKYTVMYHSNITTKLHLLLTGGKSNIRKTSENFYSAPSYHILKKYGVCHLWNKALFIQEIEWSRWNQWWTFTTSFTINFISPIYHNGSTSKQNTVPLLKVSIDSTNRHKYCINKVFFLSFIAYHKDLPKKRESFPYCMQQPSSPTPLSRTTFILHFKMRKKKLTSNAESLEVWTHSQKYARASAPI